MYVCNYMLYVRLKNRASCEFWILCMELALYTCSMRPYALCANEGKID